MQSPEVAPPSTPEPEPPNPFNELTDQALEEYRIEVERKQLAVDGKTPTPLIIFSSSVSYRVHSVR